MALAFGPDAAQAGRTMQNVIRLMDQFPNITLHRASLNYMTWCAGLSALFDAIKARVAEGRWNLSADVVEATATSAVRIAGAAVLAGKNVFP